LPALLAYFLVGLALGPHTFGWLPDSESNRELAEFGIVFLMFSIGLEFSLPKLYAMRRTVFGLGSAQVVLTMGLLMAAAMVLGMDWRGAIMLGGALAMSSTAIVSKMLVERLELNSRHGQLAVGVLLFQDIAVVPLLILIPALAAPVSDLAASLGSSLLKAVITLAILLVFGKSVVNPWFDLVARQKSRELFVMNVLMVTLALAFITKQAGLSYALGAFIAGMLISETRYRYQVESDIAPFRDILLGLFFITMGMMLNIHELIGNIGEVFGVLLALTLVKIVLVIGIAKLFRHEIGVAVRAGLTLAQAGEFSFVLLAQGAEYDLLSPHQLQLVLAASLLSMVFAPLLIHYNGRFVHYLSRSYQRNRESYVQDMKQVGEQFSDHVIICGYGRSGQYLGRFLAQEHIPFIALDIDPARVRDAAEAGETVLYGDAARRVVLQAAGIERAKAMVISYADPHSALKILHVVQELYPALPVIVRTLDETSMEKLRDAGAAEVVPEVLEGSLMLASQTLVLLGIPLNRVVKRIRQFREERYKLFKGFFHGISDAGLNVADKHQPRMHSVSLAAGAFAIGKQLQHIGLETCSVELKSVRRRGIRGIDPVPETEFKENDVVVLLGMPKDLVVAEALLLKGA
jgi:CPA2 family monovalent cation:H+ antiporter-2